MTDQSTANNESGTPAWRTLDRKVEEFFPWNAGNVLALILLALAVVTRLYGLGDRVVTHDELNTITAAYSLATSGNMGWSPMMHGPLEMFLTAAAFVLFGDNDVTARLPMALFGIATVGIALFLFRRYLGRAGALLAGLFFLISPYMLYYARYTRNEIMIVVWSLLWIYAVLRYLERGETKMLVLFTAVYAFHSTDKITSLIHAGGLMFFLVGYFLVRLMRRLPRRPDIPRVAFYRFLAGLAVAAVFLTAAALMLRGADSLTLLPGIVVGVIGLAAAVVGTVLLLREGNILAEIRSERSFDLILLLGTLTLPLITAVPIRLFGFNPQDIGASNLSTSVMFLLPLAAVSAAIGIWWRPKVWPFLAALFFAIYAFFFTNAFTNGIGLADGLFNFLGYWISVQLQEGHLVSQPWYYYLVIQIPVYEYLPAIGACIAFLICVRRRLWSTAAGKPFERPAEDPAAAEHPVPFMTLVLFWSVFNVAVFTAASEKMPQQTALMAAPMILALAWAVGYLLEKHPGEIVRTVSGRTFTLSAGITGTFRSAALAALGLLALLTARTAYQSSFINYNLPYEYLTYANCANSTGIVFKEIERLSYLTTGGTDLVVAYDNNVRYPYWWYLRRYKNSIDFDVNPTADIRRAAIIVVGEQNDSKVIPLLGEDYVSFSGTRMWWHNQEFWNLKWDFINSDYLSQAGGDGLDSTPSMTIPDYLRLVLTNHILPILRNPQARSAVFQIWLNRDFTEWGEYVQHGGYTAQDWSQMERLHIYFRKDLLDYLGGAAEDLSGGGMAYDPYEMSRIDLVPDFTVGQAGGDPGLFAAPRGLAAAPDGSIYIADSMNHRIQHINPDGSLIRQWGSFGSVDQGVAPGGTFNEPWGVAVGPDGSVYVADTWNHRVQKFTADGEFLTMWGAPPSDSTAAIAFYGPRAIAVDGRNRVFVSDTGNKRIMIFSSEGELLGQFGSPGASEGALDEPVGLALDELGRVYVADTWNRRVQIFAPGTDGSYESVAAWEVNAWFGTTAEIKPYLAVDSNHHVYITDPSTCRILEFTERGVILAVWGNCGDDGISLNSPTGIAVDPQGGLWVSDSRHDRLVHYPMPSSGGDLLRLP